MQATQYQRVGTNQKSEKTCVNYYPFGMRMSGMHFSNTDLINKFLYNGKELQDQTNYLDYGFRQMDPQLGRWHVVDALTESYMSHSPYAYTKNDPINHIDVMGLAPYSRPWMPNMLQTLSIGGGGAVYNGGALNQDFMNGGASFEDFGPGFEDFFTEIGGVWVDNDDIISINFEDGTVSVGDNFTGYYGSVNGNITSLTLDGIGSWTFEDGTKVSDVVSNGALLDGIPNPVNPYDGSITGQILKWMKYINNYSGEYLEYNNQIVSDDLFHKKFKDYVGWVQAIRKREYFGKYGAIDYFIMRPTDEISYPISEVSYNEAIRRIQIESTDVSSQSGGTFYIWLQFSNRETYTRFYNYIFQ